MEKKLDSLVLYVRALYEMNDKAFFSIIAFITVMYLLSVVAYFLFLKQCSYKYAFVAIVPLFRISAITDVLAVNAFRGQLPKWCRKLNYWWILAGLSILIPYVGIYIVISLYILFMYLLSRFVMKHIFKETISDTSQVVLASGLALVNIVLWFIILCRWKQIQ